MFGINTADVKKPVRTPEETVWSVIISPQATSPESSAAHILTSFQHEEHFQCSADSDPILLKHKPHMNELVRNQRHFGYHETVLWYLKVGCMGRPDSSEAQRRAVVSQPSWSESDWNITFLSFCLSAVILTGPYHKLHPGRVWIYFCLYTQTIFVFSWLIKHLQTFCRAAHIPGENKDERLHRQEEELNTLPCSPTKHMKLLELWEQK